MRERALTSLIVYSTYCRCTSCPVALDRCVAHEAVVSSVVLCRISMARPGTQESSYSLAKSALKDAKAPEAMAISCQGVWLGVDIVDESCFVDVKFKFKFIYPKVL